MKHLHLLAVLLVVASPLSMAAPSQTQPQSLDEAAVMLGKEASAPVRPYSTRDFGRDRFSGARSVLVPPTKAEQLLTRIRPRLGKGLVAFIGTTHNLATPKVEGMEIVVGMGATQFDILRIAASDAVNYDMVTEDLIKKLQAWDAAYGIDIIQAETDTIQLRLRSLPKDMRKFSEEVYAFCPDIVDQGVGSVDELEKEITKSRQVFLWWD